MIKYTGCNTCIISAEAMVSECKAAFSRHHRAGRVIEGLVLLAAVWTGCGAGSGSGSGVSGACQQGAERWPGRVRVAWRWVERHASLVFSCYPLNSC